MALTIEIWEDSGPLAAGVPLVREKVTNVNWKRIGGATNAYFINPLRIDDVDHRYSYKKYVYAKIIGNYSKIKRIRWAISIDQDLGQPIRLYYDMTNQYVVPNDDIGAMTYVPLPTAALLQTSFSTTGPQTATTHLDTVASNTTVYTDYLVTQIRASKDTNTFGNSNVIKFQLIVDEYE